MVGSEATSMAGLAMLSRGVLYRVLIVTVMLGAGLLDQGAKAGRLTGYLSSYQAPRGPFAPVHGVTYRSAGGSPCDAASPSHRPIHQCAGLGPDLVDHSAPRSACGLGGILAEAVVTMAETTLTRLCQHGRVHCSRRGRGHLCQAEQRALGPHR